jgi:small subunit ribosomal protein S20
MPITQSAKKAIRGSLRKKAFNDQRKKVMKEIIKKIERVVKADIKNGKEQAAGLLSEAFQAIDKAAQKGVIKKNNAARKKSRLSKLTK